MGEGLWCCGESFCGNCAEGSAIAFGWVSRSKDCGQILFDSLLTSLGKVWSSHSNWKLMLLFKCKSCWISINTHSRTAVLIIVMFMKCQDMKLLCYAVMEPTPSLKAWFYTWLQTWPSYWVPCAFEEKKNPKQYTLHIPDACNCHTSNTVYENMRLWMWMWNFRFDVFDRKVVLVIAQKRFAWLCGLLSSWRGRHIVNGPAFLGVVSLPWSLGCVVAIMVIMHADILTWASRGIYDHPRQAESEV